MAKRSQSEQPPTVAVSPVPEAATSRERILRTAGTAMSWQLLNLSWGQPLDVLKVHKQLVTPDLSYIKIARQLVAEQGLTGLWTAAGTKMAQQLAKSAGRGVAVNEIYHEMGRIFTEDVRQRYPLAKEFTTAWTVALLDALVTTPMDVCKTRQIGGVQSFWQVMGNMWNQSSQSMMARHYGTPGAAFSSVQNAYTGFGVGYCKLGVSWSTFLVTQEMFKSGYRAQTGNQELSKSAIVASGVGSGVAKVFVTAPIESIKARLQGPEAIARGELNVFSVARHLWQEQGLRGFFRGSVPRLGHGVAAGVGGAVTMAYSWSLRNQPETASWVSAVNQPADEERGR